MPQKHKYTALNEAKREIRLLHLTSLSSGSKYGYEEICACGRLEKTDLEQNEDKSYMALSYVWGEPNYTSAIILDDDTYLPITSSLHDALMHLFVNGFAPDMGPIWIDAVCIDQLNDTEKSWQVSQMGNIYRSAKQTLIYLGPDTEYSNEAVDVFRDIGQRAAAFGLMSPYGRETFVNAIKTVASLWLKRRGSEELTTSINFLIHNIIIKRDETVIKSDLTLLVASLMDRPWWRRVWVLQELLLACKLSSWTATFICGRRTIRAKDVVSTLFCLDILYHTLKQRSPASNADFRLFEVDTCESQGFLTPPSVKLLVRRSEADLQFGFVNLLSTIQFNRPRLKSTDPRDYVYALLGIAFLEESQEPILWPDYSKPCSIVYVEAAIALLKLNCRQLLRAAASCKGSVSLPSWVPDFSATIRSWDKWIEFCEYNRQLKWSYRLTLDNKHVLTVPGRIHGTIQLLTPEPFSSIHNAITNIPFNDDLRQWRHDTSVVQLPEYCIGLGRILSHSVTDPIRLRSLRNMLALAMNTTPLKQNRYQEQIGALVAMPHKDLTFFANTSSNRFWIQTAILADMLNNATLFKSEAMFSMPEEVRESIERICGSEKQSDFAWAVIISGANLERPVHSFPGLAENCKRLLDIWGIDEKKVVVMDNILMRICRFVEEFQPFICGDTYVGVALNRIKNGDVLARFDMDPDLVFVLRPVGNEGMFELIDKACVPQLIPAVTIEDGERQEIRLC